MAWNKSLASFCINLHTGHESPCNIVLLTCSKFNVVCLSFLLSSKTCFKYTAAKITSQRKGPVVTCSNSETRAK